MNGKDVVMKWLTGSGSTEEHARQTFETNKYQLLVSIIDTALEVVPVVPVVPEKSYTKSKVTSPRKG